MYLHGYPISLTATYTSSNRDPDHPPHILLPAALPRHHLDLLAPAAAGLLRAERAVPAVCADAAREPQVPAAAGTGGASAGRAEGYT